MNPHLPSIAVPELAQLREGGLEFALFDVREPAEAHRGHIFGATFLPRRQIEQRIVELVPRTTTPIVVCDGGGGDQRAERAALTLAGLGYPDVRVLAGGTRAWCEDSRTLTEGSNVPSKLFGEEVHGTDDVPRIPAQELARWQAAGRPHLVCDIRSPEEYARSRIPGALGAYGADLALLAADLHATGKPVVVHCSGRTRSIIACQGLRALGVTNVYALENGTMGWQLAGHELERGAGAGPLAPSAASAAEGERAARTLAVAAGAKALPPQAFTAWMRERSAQRTNLYPIDVRQVSEYVAGHLPGSIAVPGGLAIQRADEFVPVRTGRIVFIDRCEARAWLTAYWFRRMGFTEVHVLEGGIDAWLRGGGVLEPGRGRGAPAGWDEARRLAHCVSADELGGQIADGLVVNVDTSRHFTNARLPGSRWIPYGGLEDHAAALAPGESARMVLTCRDGMLSTLAAGNLARMGLEGVRVLAGGVEAWQRAGHAIASGPDATAQAGGDLVVQPYDAGREGMQRYLDWEQKLTAQSRH